jgi:hypothetical protein
MKNKLLLKLCFLLLFATTSVADHPAKPAAGASENHLDVSYLPANRDVAYVEQNKANHSARVNVHVPPGEGPFPCLLVIHGGGYLAGNKDTSEFHGLCEAAIGRGYVAVNVGYIKGLNIHPQVQRDIKTLVRWLRANASRFRVDPDRIGAWGFSAGGWLASSSVMSTVDDIGTRSIRSVRLTESLNLPATEQTKSPPNSSPRMMVPFDAVEPLHGGLNSRLNAIVADFHHTDGRLTPDDPIVATYVGLGVKNGMSHEAFRAAGVPLVEIELSEEQTRGKPNWHVPNLNQIVMSRDREARISLEDRMFEFLEAHLKTELTRTVPPEARPNRRIFTQATTVSLVASSPRATIHFTTDGSEPTPGSPVFQTPLSIKETTTVRAIAIIPGMRPSGPITADFIRGETPPEIIGPKTLPVAQVGKPFSVEFSSTAESPVWDIAFQTRSVFGREGLSTQQREELAEAIRRFGNGAEQIGLRFDRNSGVLSGTATKAGIHIVQIRVARNPGQAASDKTYVLRIEPKEN